MTIQDASQSKAPELAVVGGVVFSFSDPGGYPKECRYRLHMGLK